MAETPPTKPPLPPLRSRLKLPDNCVDVTDQHIGEVFVLTGYGSWDGSATAKWEKIDPEKKPDDELKGGEAEGDSVHDLVPDASPPPPNEAIVTSGAGP